MALFFAIPGYYADLECYDSGEVLAVLSDRQGRPDVWEVEATPEGITVALLKMLACLEQHRTMHKETL